MTFFNVVGDISATFNTKFSIVYRWFRNYGTALITKLTLVYKPLAALLTKIIFMLKSIFAFLDFLFGFAFIPQFTKISC